MELETWSVNAGIQGLKAVFARLEGRDVNSFDQKALKKALKAVEEMKKKTSDLDDRKRCVSEGDVDTRRGAGGGGGGKRPREVLG